MAAITGISGTGATLIPDLFESNVEYVVNNMRGVVKAVNDTGDKYFGPGGKVHIPIVGAITATTVTGAPATIGTLTFTANTETEIVFQPTVTYAAVQIQEDVLQSSITDSVAIYSPALAESIYQKIEVDILSLFASFTTNSQTDAADFTIANFQTLISKILANGGDKVALGQLTGVYHPLKWDTMMGIADMYSAAVRGENNGPAKTGTFDSNFGINIVFTSNVQTSTTLRNLIFARRAIWLVRKNRPKIEMERSDLHTKVVASTMYAAKVVHEKAGGQHIITTLT